MRSGRWTCGPASPTPSYSCIVSIMSSISARNLPALMSAASTPEAFMRRTGWPRRATFRIDMLAILSCRFGEQRLLAHPQSDEERDRRQHRAAVEGAASLSEVVEESAPDRTEKTCQRSDPRSQSEHASVLAGRRSLRYQRRQRRIRQSLADGDEECDHVEQRHAPDQRHERQSDRERRRADCHERLFAEPFGEASDQAALNRRHDQSHEEEEPSQVALREMEAVARVQRD